ncbi:hypothetical protein ACS0TY_029548 [Phlomoides rotata]
MVIITRFHGTHSQLTRREREREERANFTDRGASFPVNLHQQRSYSYSFPSDLAVFSPAAVTFAGVIP